MSAPVRSRLDRAVEIALCLFAGALPFSISLAQGALGLLIALTLWRAIRPRLVGFALRLPEWLLLAFLAWVALTAPLAPDPGDALARLPRFWIWSTYFVCLAAASSAATARRALYTLVAVAGAVGLYGVAQHFYGDAVPRFLAPPVTLWQKTGGYNHAVGLFDHHLTFGNSLAITILLGLGLWLAERGWRRRALLAAALAAAGLGLLWSYARSAWLGLVGGLVAFGAMQGRRYLAAVVALILAAGGLAYAASPTLAERLQRMGRSDDSLERIYIWKTTLALIGDHRLVGVGLGGYRRSVGAYRADYNIHWTAKSHAHNSYLQFAAESGAPAGLLFAGFLISLAALGARRHDELKESDGPTAWRWLTAGATAAVVGFAVASLLQHNAGDAEVCMQFQLAAALATGLARGEAQKTT